MIPYQLFFESHPGKLVILSPEFYVQAVTDSFLKEAQMEREAIIGKYLFDLFPDNPTLPEASSLTLKFSLENVLATGKRHKMKVFRYDIPDPLNPSIFLERYWQTTNMPILDATGAVQYIIHETINATEQVKAADQLQAVQESEQKAIAQAEQQRIRLERLFAQAPAGLALLEGPDLEYKVVNEAYQHLFPGRHLLGLGLFEAFPEIKNQPIAEIIQQVYKTGETYEGKEFLAPVARFPNGPVEDVYWNFIYQALLDSQGRINGILIFALDVTDFVLTRRQAEKIASDVRQLNYLLEEKVARRTRALQVAQAEAERHRQRLESLFLHAPAPICILNGPDLIYELVNPSYERLFPGRDLLDTPLLKVLPEITENPSYKTLREVYKTGITHEEPEMLIPINRPGDGLLENRYFRYIQQARRNENGDIDGVLVYAFEVTEQVMARHAIEESAQQLHLITDSLPVLVSYLDKEQKYRFVNKAYESWFNVKTQDLLGHPVREIVGEEAYQNIEQNISLALTGKRLDFETVMPYREGFTKHVQLSYVPNLKDGEVIGIYTMVNDITEQVKARQELEEMNKELLAINSDLDNFVYVASHDLKAPIINIESLLKALLEELPAEIVNSTMIEQIINFMQSSIERFKRSVSDLATVAKTQKDSTEDISLLSIAKVLDEVRLDLEPIIREAGAQIVTDISSDSTLKFSASHLRSIIYNLLSNALKYRSGDRQLRIRITSHLNAGYLVLSITDNGLGMDLTKEGMIFKMFKRLHDHVEGSGVGLYIVNKIVKSAGGYIEVESKINEGSTFRIYFKSN